MDTFKKIVVFGFDGSHLLCMIEIRDIKKEEMDILKESLKLCKVLTDE